jgi:cell division protein FtsX
VTEPSVAVFVRRKLAGCATPVIVAVTVKAPGVVFAVNVEAVAKPFASVVSVSVFVEFDANVPLAPDPAAGAANVTGTPFAVTTATSGANAVSSATVCGDPLDTAIDWTGGLELELLQPGRKTTARKIKARMLA